MWQSVWKEKVRFFRTLLEIHLNNYMDNKAFVFIKQSWLDYIQMNFWGSTKTKFVMTDEEKVIHFQYFEIITIYKVGELKCYKTSNKLHYSTKRSWFTCFIFNFLELALQNSSWAKTTLIWLYFDSLMRHNVWKNCFCLDISRIFSNKLVCSTAILITA